LLSSSGTEDERHSLHRHVAGDGAAVELRTGAGNERSLETHHAAIVYGPNDAKLARALRKGYRRKKKDDCEGRSGDSFRSHKVPSLWRDANVRI
jgi:hypothetical protein